MLDSLLIIYIALNEVYLTYKGLFLQSSVKAKVSVLLDSILKIIVFHISFGGVWSEQHDGEKEK